MIRVDETQARTLHLFLSKLDLEIFENFAADTHDWEKGRQSRFDEYYKLDIKELVIQGSIDDELAWLADVGERALDELRNFTSVNELGDNWDAYLLYYPNQGFVGRHRDPVEEGFQHVRLNAVIRAPKSGGEFQYWPNAQPLTYPMNTAGEAIIFSPSDLDHQVCCVEGSRLMLSIGCKVPR